MCVFIISSPASHILFGTFSDFCFSHFSVTFSLTLSSFLSSFYLRYMDSEGRVRPLTAAVKAELLTVIDNMAKVSQLSFCCVQDLYVLITIFFLLIVGSTAHVSLCLFVQLSNYSIFIVSSFCFLCHHLVLYLITLFSISSSCFLSHHLVLYLIILFSISSPYSLSHYLVLYVITLFSISLPCFSSERSPHSRLSTQRIS